MGIPMLSNYTDKIELGPAEIHSRIMEWKSEHLGEQPTLAVDFKNLTYLNETPGEVDICGGNHKVAMQSFENVLDQLKALECKLVFFADVVTPDWKTVEWMNRQNSNFNTTLAVYDKISAGVLLEDIPKQIRNFRSPNCMYYEMWKMASKYGEFPGANKNDNDLELAQYAAEPSNNVLAIISSDSDFLIYDGPWKMWNFVSADPLKMNELDKEGLWDKLQLPPQKRPLFATLAGNDYTKHLFTDLSDRKRFNIIVKFIRTLDFGNGALDFDIDKAAQIGLDSNSDTKKTSKNNRRLIKRSISSYDINRELKIINDSFELNLKNTPLYQSYVALTYHFVGIAIPYYDMRGRRSGNLPMVLRDMINRKKGVLLHGRERKPKSYCVMTKIEFDRDFERIISPIEYPTFSIPPLDQVFFGCPLVHGMEITEKRWKIFEFIMSPYPEVVAKIKVLEKRFRLVCTTLCVLVKEHLLSVEEADGILSAEWTICHQNHYGQIPTGANVEHIRAIHIYNFTFNHIRENFMISGLLSDIQDELQIDGVYYQNIMKEFESEEIDFPLYLDPIRKCRIYA